MNAPEKQGLPVTTPDPDERVEPMAAILQEWYFALPDTPDRWKTYARSVLGLMDDLINRRLQWLAERAAEERAREESRP